MKFIPASSYKYLLTAGVVLLLLGFGLIAYISSLNANYRLQPASETTSKSVNIAERATPSPLATNTAKPTSLSGTVVTAQIIYITATTAVLPTASSTKPATSGLTATTTSVPTAKAIFPTVTPSPEAQIATDSPEPAPTSTPSALNFQPANRKLTVEERNSINKVEQDISNLKASLDRLDGIMTDLHPEQPDWQAKLEQEISLWQGLLSYYKSTPMPGRVGSMVMPIWLAALARLDRAGQLMPVAYQQANGKGVSQADQEVAYAQIELTRVGNLISSLRQL
mgnify:CR=1 FL=1